MGLSRHRIAKSLEPADAISRQGRRDIAEPSLKYVATGTDSGEGYVGTVAASRGGKNCVVVVPYVGEASEAHLTKAAPS